jgi:hypothetical protein
MPHFNGGAQGIHKRLFSIDGGEVYALFS